MSKVCNEKGMLSKFDTHRTDGRRKGQRKTTRDLHSDLNLGFGGITKKI